jgi:hypothetical protein
MNCLKKLHITLYFRIQSHRLKTKKTPMRHEDCSRFYVSIRSSKFSSPYKAVVKLKYYHILYVKRSNVRRLWKSRYTALRDFFWGADLIVQNSLLVRKTNAIKSVHKICVFRNLKQRDGSGSMTVAFSVDWF